MKTEIKSRISTASAIALGGLVLSSGVSQAAPFLYAPGDLILTFRQVGNASEFAVNIGPASNYNAVPEGASLPVNSLTAAQFALAFPSINGVSWSVSGANRPPVDPGFPIQTLWVSSPRNDPAVPAIAWLRKGQFVQGTAGGQIAGVGINAAQASSSQPAGPGNTETGVIIASNSDFAFSPVLGDGGDFLGTFQGVVEGITPADFDSDPSAVSRLDFYELLPGTTAGGTLNTPGRYLGYFELKPDASLSFTNIPEAPPAPTITGITRLGSVTVVSFPTVTGAGYVLRAVDGAGLASPINTWANAGSVPGDGTVRSIEDTSDSDARFYAVEVLP
ncbi:MAG: hypothetical protein KF791_10760 [Verrucomicrobiae bacterium]|nr:hypothetical protein [Verrucomicrobiae bacterium]